MIKLDTVYDYKQNRITNQQMNIQISTNEVFIKLLFKKAEGNNEIIHINEHGILVAYNYETGEEYKGVIDTTKLSINSMETFKYQTKLEREKNEHI